MEKAVHIGGGGRRVSMGARGDAPLKVGGGALRAVHLALDRASEVPCDCHAGRREEVISGFNQNQLFLARFGCWSS